MKTLVVGSTLLAVCALSLTACGNASAPTATTAPSSTAPAVTSLSPAPSGPSVTAAALPATAAGAQLAWVIASLNAGKAVPDAVLREHFSDSFLAAIPPAKLISALSSVAAAGPFTYSGPLGPSTQTKLLARIDGAAGSLKVSVSVDTSSQQRINGLAFAPYTAVTKPASWGQADASLRSLASQAGLFAAEVTTSGELRPLHELDAGRVGAIGSAFKLYVLGALGEAIEQHRASWDEQLAIHQAWKSLPSGTMQDDPAGTRYPLRTYAQQMIAISDNTAADHLIHRVGRAAVEAELARLGNSDPARDTPFLTTREMFALKLGAPQTLRRAYVAASSAQRALLLPQIDKLPLSLKAAESWTTPRDIGTIEWFASPRDLGRAMVGLRALARKPGLAPIRTILSRNPGMTFDPTTWAYTAYKGGSEIGVLSLTWLLERQDGRTFVLSITLDDPTQVIDEAGAVEVAQGAVDLLASVK
jgi:beta-lactamase class A